MNREIARDYYIARQKVILGDLPLGKVFFFSMPILLYEESSELTTFILLYGRYQFLRAPLGLSASLDEWCQRSDKVIKGQHVSWVSTRVKIAGHIILHKRVMPNPECLKAISNFSTPANTKEVHGFLGFVNQLASFNPDLLRMTANLRGL